MPPKMKRNRVKPVPKAAGRPARDEAETVVAELKRLGTKKARDGMARYAIPSHNALGVPVGVLQKLAKRAAYLIFPALRRYASNSSESASASFLPESSTNSGFSGGS